MTNRVVVKRAMDTLTLKIARATKPKDKAERDVSLRIISDLLRRPVALTPHHQKALADLFLAIANDSPPRKVTNSVRGRPANAERDSHIRSALESVARQFPNESHAELVRIFSKLDLPAASNGQDARDSKYIGRYTLVAACPPKRRSVRLSQKRIEALTVRLPRKAGAK